MIKVIDKELDEMMLYDIIVPVEWISQLVFVPKKNPDESQANKAIRRVNFVTTTLSENDMQGVVVSEADFRKAFYNFLLADEKSRDITIFKTHRGLFRFKRVRMVPMSQWSSCKRL